MFNEFFSSLLILNNTFHLLPRVERCLLDFQSGKILPWRRSWVASSEFESSRPLFCSHYFLFSPVDLKKLLKNCRAWKHSNIKWTATLKHYANDTKRLSSRGRSKGRYSTFLASFLLRTASPVSSAYVSSLLRRTLHFDNLLFIVNIQRHFPPLSALFLVHDLPGPIHQPALFPFLPFILVITSRRERQIRGPRRCRTAAQFGTRRIDHLEQHQIGAEGCCEGMFSFSDIPFLKKKGVFQNDTSLMCMDWMNDRY